MMRNSKLSTLSTGLSAAVLFGSAPVSAAAGADQAASLFWLAGLPNWVLTASLAVFFMGLAVLGLALHRRLRPSPAGGHNRRAGLYATIGGGLVGVMVALLVAGPWQAFLLDRIASLPPTAGVPQSHRPMDLLEEPDVGDVKDNPDRPKKVKGDRARHKKVNFAAMQATSINLNLFDDTILTAVRDRVVNDMKGAKERKEGKTGGAVWVGHILGYEDNSEVVLAAKGKALMGTVKVDGRIFEIVYKGGTTHAVRELDPKSMPAKFEPTEQIEFEPDDNAAGDTVGTGTMASATSASTTGTGQVIDVMVLYTPKALANAGSVDAMQAKILNAVTRANQAYLNSQVDMQLNLVYTGQVAYTEAGDMVTTLARLSGKTDGYMDEVHALRDQYAADQVVLLDTETNYCGYAGIMTVVSTAAAGKAFAVLHDDSVYSCLCNDSFAHELGHNQGNVHNVEDTGVTGAYSDSYGYRLCGTFHDIMSYACTGEPRIPYFSNPDVTFEGVATGVLGAADTARSMNATAATVAAFRVPVTTPPTAPTNLTGSATATDTITLAWTDSAGTETGYKVQSSTDGTNWVEIASLGQNAVGYVDAGLATGKTYSYRVYGYNSVGNSGYSNTAAVTLSAPRDTTAPVVKISSPLPGTKVGLTVSIKSTATDNIGLSSLKLYIDKVLVGATNTGTLNYTWSTSKVTKGTHTIRAEAVDRSSNTGTTSVSVTK